MPRLRRTARGLTLLELLVTIMIMGIMIAVAVPVIRPPVDARSVKEAARMVSTALASARTKAIETGQSWGVEFTPFPSDPRQVGTLHFVRVTSPYTGTGENNVADGQWGGPYDSESGTLKLNYAGKEYRCPDDGSGSEGTLSADPPPDGSYDFQFYPAPKKSSLMPIQLPSRAVVDIGLSGGGDADQCFSPEVETPVKITFTPTGELDQVYHSAFTGGESVIERIHFFIGKTGRTGTTSDPEDNHLYDGEAIWVSVDPRTGAIKSTENYPVNDGSVVTARTWADQ